MEIPPTSMLPLGGISGSNAAATATSASSEEAAEAFEAMFASLLVKEMRQTLPEGLFGSETSDVYGALFDQHIGQTIAEGEGLGIRQFIMSHAKGLGGQGAS